MSGDRAIFLRAPVLEEVGAVFDVISARDLVDLGEVDFQLADLDGEWRNPELDLSRDVRVAERAGDGVVGYGRIRPEGSFAVVHPRYQREPVLDALLDWTEERELALGRTRHRQWIAATNGAAVAILRSRGYERARSVFRLCRSLAEPPQPLAPPAGVALRRLDPDADGVQVHALDSVAFADADDYVPESFAAFDAEHLQAHDLDREISRVACREGTIVGFLIARRWLPQRVGFVDLLAVDPAFHRGGIGAALLSAALADFAACGLAQARLGVSSTNSRARRLYRRLGMHERHRFDIYERLAG